MLRYYFYPWYGYCTSEGDTYRGYTELLRWSTIYIYIYMVCDDETVNPFKTVCDLGTYIDGGLTMKAHVSHMVSSLWLSVKLVQKRT